MKVIYLTFTLMYFVIASSASLAAGGRSDGGGDLCEDRIKVIRDDFDGWIQKGGPSGLAFPPSVTTQQYSDEMRQQIKVAKIRCVGPNDDGFPIMIEHTPKICRFDRDNEKSQITCDLLKFSSLNESDQYVLVHHEYAGLAGIELPNGDDSNYLISNQISEYLVDQIVKKLSVKPAKSIACSSMELKNAPVGTKCITSVGAIYERVYREGFGEAWRGQDGLIWGDLIKDSENGQTFDDAEKTCKNHGGRLPSKSEFTRGEVNGFREVLSGWDNPCYWSSTLENAGPPFIYYFVFSGRSGEIGSYVAEHESGVTRCVVK